MSVVLAQVLHLLYHVFIMIVDRLAYLNRSLAAKLFAQCLSVAYVHYKVFYASPSATGAVRCGELRGGLPHSVSRGLAVASVRARPVSVGCWRCSPVGCVPGIPSLSNPPVIGFYVGYFTYFLLGAAQLYLGFERSPPKDSLKQFKGVYPILFKCVRTPVRACSPLGALLRSCGGVESPGALPCLHYTACSFPTSCLQGVQRGPFPSRAEAAVGLDYGELVPHLERVDDFRIHVLGPVPFHQLFSAATGGAPSQGT